jgi:hypothetical protein
LDFAIKLDNISWSDLGEDGLAGGVDVDRIVRVGVVGANRREPKSGAGICLDICVGAVVSSKPPTTLNKNTDRDQSGDICDALARKGGLVGSTCRSSESVEASVEGYAYLESLQSLQRGLQEAAREE